MRAVLYTRVSTETQQESGLGLSSQLVTCERHAERLGADVVGTFTDAVSGKAMTNRPELQNALALLASGGADVLIVAKLDRLSRSVRDLCDLLDLSQRQGWALVLGDLVDTTSPAGRVQAHVVAAFAEYERQLISQRTRDAMAQAQARGVHCGRTSALPVSVGRRVVNERDAGRTWQAIADGLNADAVPTVRGGACWRVSSVRAAYQVAGRGTAQVTGHAVLSVGV
jgi:DNA invertase Pin-like site-specific DNA recombinase